MKRENKNYNSAGDIKYEMQEMWSLEGEKDNPEVYASFSVECSQLFTIICC